jgi:hypothetical protein
MNTSPSRFKQVWVASSIRKMLAAVLTVFIANPCLWAASVDVTTRTQCPDLYSATQLPVVYDVSKPVLKKGLSPEDIEETKAILQDTMGSIRR